MISVPDLLDDLSRRVISANDLDQQALLLRPGGGDAPSPWPGALRFRHRYAEPFAELESVLLLKPLPGLGGLDEILGLTVLLVVVAALGLVAVERMLAAQLGYAQRRSDFVSAVTHELKTPLTSIRMYGEMLRDGMVASEERRGQYHATITSEAERLGRLVDNVLELGRLERRDRGVQLVSADIRPLVGRTLEVLEPHAAELGFELRLQAPAELPPARHDPDALEQVVFNLVDNALKYAAASEPRRVDVELQADSEAVVLSVSDHGPGVPERQLRRIFRPFYRGERELTRRHRGTGIGLALVRGLVERIGGRVSARNREGGGLRVELRLPLV